MYVPSVKSVFESFMSLAELKSSQVFKDSQLIYALGFENSGIEADPQLDVEYRPSADSPAATGAIDLSAKGWPGVDDTSYRGAKRYRGGSARQGSRRSGPLSYPRA